MPFQECLLGRMSVGAMERCAAGHASHRKYLQLYPLACQVGVSLIPVDLRFHSPGVALRDEGLPNRHVERDFPVVHVLSHRALPNRTVRHLGSDPLPNPMRCVSLLSRRLAIGLQNAVYELNRGLHFPARSLCLLSRLRQRTADRLPNHPPVNAQFLGHAGDGPHAKLVLPTDLLKQLHFGSPLQRVPSASGYTRIRVPVHSSGGGPN